MPRLELDELLGQLVERAQEVMGTQGRLRGLLRASQMVSSDLALPVVLRRIVDAARDLVGARYAALGVISSRGGLAEFVHSGMPPDVVRRIGDLPQGKGLLGALIDDPAPIRLGRIDEDDRSSGFPPDHPPMASFLGVPIRVRDEVYGNLYLAESHRGAFTAEDEELAQALAATAAAAIGNARLYESARLRGEWLQAQAAITRQVLSGDPDEAIGSLRLIAETSRQLARADLVTVVLPADGDLRVDVAVGADAAELLGTRLSLSDSLSGRVFTSLVPLRSDIGEESAAGFLVTPPVELGPVLAVPLLGAGGARGVLWAARRRGGAPFDVEELDLAAGFANQAAVAIELAEARAEKQRASMFEERERIAADLHDHVIQRLFAAGLTLQSVAATLEKGRSADRILSTVDDLDNTIRQIRTSIFQLHLLPQSGMPGLRAQLLDVAAELTPALGFEPSVRFSGLLDALPDDVAEDVVAVLREALANVARHAHARRVDVDLTRSAVRLQLEVRDDGDGLGASTRRSGLDNLRHRAERRGGTFHVRPNEPRGTCLSWTIPLGT
ncbi:MAG TPA: GAF domain-containing protein [Mycobacteriales bacterium]